MAERIQAGKYQAKISNYTISTTKGGDPQVAILFDYEDQDGTPHEITWFGTLKPGEGQKITLQALLNCGMQGNQVSALAGGLDSGVLDADTPVTIVIAPEEYQGKTNMRVKWVNRSGGAAFRNALSKDEAKLKLGALNLEGAMAALRHETGQKDQPRMKKAAGSTYDPNFDRESQPSYDDDIGF